MGRASFAQVTGHARVDELLFTGQRAGEPDTAELQAVLDERRQGDEPHGRFALLGEAGGREQRGESNSGRGSQHRGSIAPWDEPPCDGADKAADGARPDTEVAPLADSGDTRTPPFQVAL